MGACFRVGISRNLLNADGTADTHLLGLDELIDAAGIAFEFLEEYTPVLAPHQAGGYDALLLENTAVSAASLAGLERLALIARFGAGFDSIDLDACTERGILVTNAPDGVRRPMAVVNLSLILAVTQHVLIKDSHARTNQWDRCMEYMGMGLTGRTLGLVGLGNVGRELLALIKPFGMRHIAYDPFVSPAAMAELGITAVDLDALMTDSDVVCITCALTPETRGMIDARLIDRMKPSAFFVNAARGPIVDQRALTRALVERRIRGAGLDVFSPEPPEPDDPLLTLDNVVLSPHSLACTDECFRGIGLSATRSILAVARGELPHFVVNRAVLDQPSLHMRLQSFARTTGLSSIESIESEE